MDPTPPRKKQNIQKNKIKQKEKQPKPPRKQQQQNPQKAHTKKNKNTTQRNWILHGYFSFNWRWDSLGFKIYACTVN